MVVSSKRLNSSVYIGDLAESVTEELLYETFQQAGSIQSVRLCRDSNTRKSLGYGYINYHTADEAARALETLNHTPLCGKAVRLMPSQRDPSARRSGVGNVFVKNFDPDTVTNKVLHETFEQYGVVLSAKVALDSAGRSKGYGFIQYEDPDSAAQAIEGLNNAELHGQALFVGPFVPAKDRAAQPGKFCNVYVRNIGSDVDEEVLRSVFGRFGSITSTVVMRNSSNKSRGFGFVNFEKPDHAAAAVEGMNGYRHDGIKWRVNRAQKREDLEDESEYQQPRLVRSNLYLRNLHKDCTDQELQDLFQEFGEVENARVLKDASGVSKGIGFVQFANSEDAEAAITGMNGKRVGNSPTPLFVTLTQRKQSGTPKNSDTLDSQASGSLTDRSPSGSFQLYPAMSGVAHHPGVAFYPAAGSALYYGAMPMAAGHQPYYMHMGAPAVPMMDRMGTLVSFPSGHYPGMGPAPSAPVPRVGYGRSPSFGPGAPMMLQARDNRASAPLPAGGLQHGILPDGHLRGRKGRGRNGGNYNPNAMAHPPPLPSSGSSGARANIPSPFSAVQAPDSPGPRGHHDPGLTGRLSGRISSRTPSQTAPSLPKPMTPAMIAEAATAKQRSRQNQRLQKLVRQIDAKWAAEIVQSLVKVNDVHQMAQLLEDEQRLREQITTLASALECKSVPTSCAMPVSEAPDVSEAPATTASVPVQAG